MNKGIIIATGLSLAILAACAPMGTPAKVVATRNNFVANCINAMLYHRNAQAYARGDHRAWAGPEFAAAMAEWKARFEGQALGV